VACTVYIHASLGFVVVYVESAAVLTLYLYVTLLVPFVLDVGTGLLAVPPYVHHSIVTLPTPFALFTVNVFVVDVNV
jgi:hypothetical protein